MKNPLFSALYFITILSAGLTIHQAFADRGPAVEPMTEISIEENRPKDVHKGFDFTDKERTPAAVVEPKRVPANITSKSTEHNAPYSLAGPIIFLLALPIALWIVVSKKIKTSDAQKVDYYPKTFQLKPNKSSNQIQDYDDEDQDFPKAS